MCHPLCNNGHFTPSRSLASQLTRAILPASSSSVSLRRALMLFTISRTKLQFSPGEEPEEAPCSSPEGPSSPGEEDLSGAGTSAALALLYTRSMDLELALTAWASSCSTPRWHWAISRILESKENRGSSGQAEGACKVTSLSASPG